MASTACKWTKLLYEAFINGDIVLDVDVTNVIDLIPSGTLNDERLTVSSVAIQTSMVPEADTTHIFWRVEGASLRVTFDDSAPVGGPSPAGNGHVLRPNDHGTWRVETWLAAKFIRDTAVDGVIQASQFLPV